jgi:hypothetical protein
MHYELSILIFFERLICEKNSFQVFGILTNIFDTVFPCDKYTASQSRLLNYLEQKINNLSNWYQKVNSSRIKFNSFVY